jgi:superoxide dismutase, Cu-Zn family
VERAYYLISTSKEQSMAFRLWGIGALGLMVVTLPAAAQTATAELKDIDGKDVGKAALVQTPSGVLIRISIKNLPAGDLAIHVHAVGDCEPPFLTAGPHFNPGGRKHGLEAPDGAHAGDMPNLHIPPNGNLETEVMNTAISLEKGKPNSVFDADGSALVLHANADDYKTDPAGNAGDRIACGVIKE